MYDIVVVGAGPSGSYFSKLASDSGFKVLQMDLKKNVGIPNHCSGLVNKRILEYSGEDIVIDVPQSAVISTPAGSVELKNKDMVVLDRIALDRKLFEDAKSTGTVSLLNTRFLEYKQQGDKLSIYYKSGDKIENVQASMLVGADGPVSLVRRKLKLQEPRLLPSLQFDVNKTDENVRIWLDKRKIRDFFAWEIPQGKTSEIGISGSYNLNIPIELTGEKVKILNKRGGIIPIGRSTLGRDNVFLIGDAAVANKATSGGGLLGAFKSAEYLIESLNHDEILLSYKRNWEKGFGKDVKNAFLMRKFIDKYEILYNYWLNLFKLSIPYINQIGDVDYPLSSGLAMLDLSFLYFPILLKYFIFDLIQIRNYSR